jgi:hypothetical protein
LTFVFISPAHGWRKDQPAQLNPPCEPHPLLEELPELEPPPKDKVRDNFLLVSELVHFGQAGLMFASAKDTRFSNSSPHWLQIYS